MDQEPQRSIPSFCTATDKLLKKKILAANRRVFLVVLGLSEDVAKALIYAHDNNRNVTAIVDADEEVCRIGYGDVEGFEYLRRQGRKIDLRKHSGIRLGLLIADGFVIVWSPTPRAVDGERNPEQPNAVVLEGTIDEESSATDSSQNEASERAMVDGMHAVEATIQPSTLSLADQLTKSLDEDSVGKQQICPEELKEVVEELKKNPPAPFDLARKVRVFSAKFQYVETELQGAEWTNRRIKIRNSLLNSDLPDPLRELLDTRIRPYRTKGDVSIDVPCIVMGQIAYNQDGKKIRVPMTQRDMESMWKAIQERYLFRLPGFGKLVRKRELSALRKEVEAFECVLQDWATGFCEQTKRDECSLVSDIVESLKGRIERSDRKERFEENELRGIVLNGLQGMRVIPPRVRIVVKDVSWESSRDHEFTAALRKNLPAEDLRGWFDEFVAV